MALFTSILSLNPEVDKFQFVNEVRLDNEAYTTELGNLSATYYLSKSNLGNNSQNIINQLNDWFSLPNIENKISKEVFSQCITLVEDILYPSTIERLSIEDIYTTPYGTVVFDWEKDRDNVFSLEIGASEIGYFIEIDGKDVKQVDAIGLLDAKRILRNDLNDFLNV